MKYLANILPNFNVVVDLWHAVFTRGTFVVDDAPLSSTVETRDPYVRPWLGALAVELKGFAEKFPTSFLLLELPLFPH
jgi:hypothetical protein